MAGAVNSSDPLQALLESRVVRVLRATCPPDACLVGGVLRDAFLGRDAADLDVVVSGAGRQVAARLAEVLKARLVDLGGERFASYRLVAPGRIVDLWDRREQSLEADLRRRDLTINSMALQLDSGRLIDPFGGRRDLDDRRLRATHPTSFSQDPLRVLRLVRFAANLDFEIETQTLELARKAVPGLAAVARERVRAEVGSLLRHPSRVKAVRLLWWLEIYPALWRPAGSTARASDPGDLLARLGRWPEEILRETSGLGAGLDWYVTSMTLLYLAANADNGDPGSGRRSAARALREGHLLTKTEKSVVARLIELEEVPESETDARWFLHRWGERWLDAVAVWSVGARAADESHLTLRRLAALSRDHATEIFNSTTLVSGDEVARLLSIAPGPEVGRCLEDLRRLQVQGLIRDREAALAFVASWEVGEKN